MDERELMGVLARLQRVEQFMLSLQQSGVLRWMPPGAEVLQTRWFFNGGQTRDASNWRWEYDLKEFDWPASDADKWPLPTIRSGSPTRKGYNVYELGNTDNAKIVHGELDEDSGFESIKPIKLPLLLCSLVRTTNGKDPRWLFAEPNDVDCEPPDEE